MDNKEEIVPFVGMQIRAERDFPCGGRVKKGEIGVVKNIESDVSLIIDFPSQNPYWVGRHNLKEAVLFTIINPLPKTNKFKFDIGEEFVVDFETGNYYDYSKGDTVVVLERCLNKFMENQATDKAYYKWKNLLSGKEFYSTENCIFTQNLIKITEEEKITDAPTEKYYEFLEDLFPSCPKQYIKGTIVKGYFNPNEKYTNFKFINNSGVEDGYTLVGHNKVIEVTEKAYLKYQELWNAYLICKDKYKIGDKVRSMHTPDIIHTISGNCEIVSPSVFAESNGTPISGVDLYYNGRYAEIVEEEEAVSQDYKPGDYLIDIDHTTNGTNYVIGLFKEYTTNPRSHVKCDWYHKTDTDRMLDSTGHPIKGVRKATLQEISEYLPNKSITINNPAVIDISTLGDKPIEIFPSKWFISLQKLSDNQRKIVEDFYNDKCSTNTYRDSGFDTLSSHNLNDEYIGDKPKTLNFANNVWLSSVEKEITFQQFEMFVLKSKPMFLSALRAEASPRFWIDYTYHDGVDPFKVEKQDKHLDIEHQVPVIVKSSKNKKSKLVII